MYLGKSNYVTFSTMFIVFRYKDYVVSLVYLQLLPIKSVENPYVFAMYPINIYSVLTIIKVF